MPDDAQPILEKSKADHCPRCFQDLPPKASRCPGCGEPIHSTRWLPFAIGIAGLLALVFALLVMYRLAANEEASNAPVRVDENAAQQPIFSDPRPASSNASESAKPDKKPPLKER